MTETLNLVLRLIEFPIITVLSVFCVVKSCDLFFKKKSVLHVLYILLSVALSFYTVVRNYEFGQILQKLKSVEIQTPSSDAESEDHPGLWAVATVSLDHLMQWMDDNAVTNEDAQAPASAPEVFDLPEGRSVAAGTLDELMQWIDDNAITHVEALAQLDSRDSLARWRTLRPEGVPSREVREKHDTEEFLHYAVVKE